MPPVTYIGELTSNKTFQGNVVIKMNGIYFAIRQPDSGLALDPLYTTKDGRGIVSTVVLNSTTVDLRRVATTIATYNFTLIDFRHYITKLVKGRAQDFVGTQVEMWVGRSNVSMDFSNYFKLPTTRVKSVSHVDDSYSFTVTEETDRMNRQVFNATTRLSGVILSTTNAEISVKDSTAAFPSSGFLKIEDEFISYDSKDDVNKKFIGLHRALYGSTAADHADNVDIFLAQKVSGNPIDVLLQLMISKSGTNISGYDTLLDGLAISESLIDIADMQTKRDEFFLGKQIELAFWDISNALDYIETEILNPFHLRFSYSRNSLFTVAVLDRPAFVPDIDVIDNDSATKLPQWDVTNEQVVNNISVDWDYDEGTQQYANNSSYTDASSIATFGLKPVLNFQFKGVKSSLAGQAIIDDFAKHLLERLSEPLPILSFSTQIDKHLLSIGDKTNFTGRAPASDGTLNFANDMETIYRSINLQNGDVAFKIAFTSYSDVRVGYISPSDTFLSIQSQSQATVGSGKGSSWVIGWKVRLWDNTGGDYTSDAVNTISAISGDIITFQNAWVTVLSAGQHRLKFADYDDVAEDQKRFCFVADNGVNFHDNKGSYEII